MRSEEIEFLNAHSSFLLDLWSVPGVTYGPCLRHPG